jgi:hypothetical protein
MNHRQAIKLTPIDHSSLPLRLIHLARSLHSRFTRHGEDGDLDQAIVNYRRATELTPVDHIDLPSWLDNLASSLYLRLTRHGKDEDLEQVVANYTGPLKVAHIPLRQPSVCFLAAQFNPLILILQLLRRSSKFPKVEAVLALWIQSCARDKISLSDVVIRDKARATARELGIPENNFKDSSRWFQNFKVRHGIRKGSLATPKGRRGNFANLATSSQHRQARMSTTTWPLTVPVASL